VRIDGRAVTTTMPTWTLYATLDLWETRGNEDGSACACPLA